MYILIILTLNFLELPGISNLQKSKIYQMQKDYINDSSQTFWNFSEVKTFTFTFAILFGLKRRNVLQLGETNLHHDFSRSFESVIVCKINFSEFSRIFLFFAVELVFVIDWNKPSILSMGIKAERFTKFQEILSRYCPSFSNLTWHQTEIAEPI